MKLQNFKAWWKPIDGWKERAAHSRKKTSSSIYLLLFFLSKTYDRLISFNFFLPFLEFKSKLFVFKKVAGEGAPKT